ncbi:GNAT family N-acetyltransferase [Devosia sp. Root105]|uniref:GNAT family N-acetyltransferase n=1 Tax=Devosia sp. Root105 TaxID=1736423 RepID=UPI0007006C49|nr:GNAT family N-acetyltransferase [Devosia sp. Root105]KQU93460.1 GCN5 family acetyltransferase [Devosia sp. Root105]
MITRDPIKIRIAEPHEAGAIAAIVVAAYAKWVPLIGREPMPMRVDYEKAVREHRFDLAVEGETILGLIETVPHPDHLWIDNVAVAPAAQGRGIGRMLLASTEQRAIAAGHPELRLVTNGAFESNIALYTRIGFVVDRIEDFLNGKAVYMRKPLHET